MELFELKESHLVQMAAVKDTHESLKEEQARWKETTEQLMDQKVELENERNELWMKHLMQGPNQAVYEAFGETPAGQRVSMVEPLEGLLSPKEKKRKSNVRKSFASIIFFL